MENKENKTLKLSPEEFADKIVDEILWPVLSKLTPEEQEKRLQAFEKTVSKVTKKKNDS